MGQTLENLSCSKIDKNRCFLDTLSSNQPNDIKTKEKPHFLSAVYLLVGAGLSLIYNNKNL